MAVWRFFLFTTAQRSASVKEGPSVVVEGGEENIGGALGGCLRMPGRAPAVTEGTTTPIRADGWRVLEVLHVLRGLYNDLTVHGHPSVPGDKAFEKIVRGGTGVIFFVFILRLAWKTSSTAGNRTCSEPGARQTC
jgi:hypothetical protein